MEKLLSFRECGERARVSEFTIRRWGRLGRLPLVRLSARALRVRESDLERFIAAHVQPAREKGR